MKQGLKQTNDKCIICGIEISQTTAARVSHMRKHVRDGSIEETKDKDGKLIWISTGKEPKEKEDTINRCWRPLSAPQIIREPRIPVAAKSDKNGKIHIKCKICNKWSKDISEFANDKFVAIRCCDKITPFPKRMVDQVIATPGKEFIE